MRISRARTLLSSKESGITGLIYGASGTGKSWLVAKCEKPLIISIEKNGIASIGHSNPDAMIVEVDNADELFEVILDASDGKIDVIENGKCVDQIEFSTLVIDSLTEAQRLIKDRLLLKNNRSEMILKDWGTLANQMERFVRHLRDLPVTVICTALVDYYDEESTGMRHCQPLFEGKKIKQGIMQYFNFVALYFKSKNKSGASERSLMFDGPQKVLCKSVHPITGVIVEPDLSEIINTIQTIQEG